MIIIGALKFLASRSQLLLLHTLYLSDLAYQTLLFILQPHVFLK